MRAKQAVWTNVSISQVPIVQFSSTSQLTFSTIHKPLYLAGIKHSGTTCFKKQASQAYVQLGGTYNLLQKCLTPVGFIKANNIDTRGTGEVFPTKNADICKGPTLTEKVVT